MQVTTALVNLMSGTRQFDQSYNNNKKNKNISAPLDSATLSTNTNLNKKNNVTLSKNSELDKIKNSDDIRDLFNEDEVQQYKPQLKILLKISKY